MEEENSETGRPTWKAADNMEVMAWMVKREKWRLKWLLYCVVTLVLLC